MAEVVTSPLRPRTISYTEKQLASFAHKFSRLKPIEAGDLCCNCGLDCDGEGFANFATFMAYRINGHPICSRPKCTDAAWDEYHGRRSGCGCGLRRQRPPRVKLRRKVYTSDTLQ